MCGEGTGGSWWQLEGNAASSTAAAGRDAGDACWWCCCRCLETHVEEGEGQARQEGRQRWQCSAAVVEAAEELCSPAALWDKADECEGWVGGGARRSCWRCGSGSSNTASQGERRDQWLGRQQSLGLELAAEGAAGVTGGDGGASGGGSCCSSSGRGGNSSGSCCSCCQHSGELLGSVGRRHGWESASAGQGSWSHQDHVHESEEGQEGRDWIGHVQGGVGRDDEGSG